MNVLLLDPQSTKTSYLVRLRYTEIRHLLKLLSENEQNKRTYGAPDDQYFKRARIISNRLTRALP